MRQAIHAVLADLKNGLVPLKYFLFLAVAAAAMGQTITDVVNAGSRTPSGYPSYGVAQGAVLAVTGTGVGTDPLQQASFPLPTTDGLGGVTVQVTVGGTTVNCIMVYISANEVGAILPSSTPVGTGTLTLNNNGQTATAPIAVVAAAFGAFTQSQNGSGAALAFNVAGDGSTVLNSLAQPTQAGQNVMLNGTGLGAITSDETQSGVTDTPAANLQVWVGAQQASVVSAGRATCCTGIDPNFRVPQGVAAWDVIQFTVPGGITGCHVPVAVQIGNTVSNFSTIAVADSSGVCTDPNGLNGNDLLNISGNTLRTGTISLTRSSSKVTFQGMTVTSNSDSGSADFWQWDLTQTPAASAIGGSIAALGSCIVIIPPKTAPGQIPVPPYTALDAGSVINVKGPNGAKPMNKGEDGGYNGTFGTSMTFPPGLLPPGFTPPGSTPPFLDAGAYSAENGGGGADVKGFTASLTIPQPMTWDNQDTIAAVVQSKGVTVQWSGGDPRSNILIFGSSAAKVGDANLAGVFLCTAPISARQFTVPPIVTLSLPPSSMGTLSVESSVSSKFTAPGIDFGTISSAVAASKTVPYQLQ
jgi:uncharacterized protein (TIGR03437 family)